MGGKGSGGRRVGAGRKPKTAREHWLTGDAGKRGLALVERPTEPSGEESPRRRRAQTAAAEMPTIGPGGEVPAELLPGERVFWERFAPLSKANGTLTPESTPGFVVLCQTAYDAQCCRAEIYDRGIVAARTVMAETGKDDEAMQPVTVELKAHPLWPSYRGLKGRLEQLMARYGLASSGAPETSKPKEDDERAKLRELLAIGRR